MTTNAAPGAPGQAGQGRIVHTPRAFVELGQPVTVEASITGGLSQEDVREAWVWYKGRDDDGYTSLEMLPRVGTFRAVIPPARIPREGLDYYIELVLKDGGTLTYPQLSPRLEPVQVSVRTAQQPAQGNPVLLVSPEPFSLVSGEVLIAVAFLQSVRELDPDRITLLLNGRDITGKASIQPEVATLVLPRLREEGRQTLEVLYGPEGEREPLGSWSFSWQASGPEGPAWVENFSGRVTTEGRLQKYSGVRQRIARQTFNVRYNGDGWYAGATGRLTSEEQGFLQPQHRYLVSLGGDHARVRYGDVKPRFNELLLWGRRVRGVELAFFDEENEVQLIYGDLARAVEGDLLLGQPDTTTGLVDTSIAPGIHRRWLAAARLAHGNSDFLMLGLTFLKARDDVSSIEYGENPRDNLALGLDTELFLDRRRASLAAQAAFSLANDDISEPPLEDAEGFKNIIWINQFFDPLPDEGLPVDSADESINASQVASSIFANSFSYKARLRLRYYRNDLQVGYRLINRSFRSLGRPNLVNDRQGWYLRDRVNLLKNRLLVSGGLERYWDNVTGKGVVRNTQDLANIGLTGFTGPKLPDVNFSYRRVENSNNGTLRIIEPDSLNPAYNDTIDTRRQDVTHSFSLGLNHRLALETSVHDLNLSLLRSDRDDAFNELGDATNLALSLGTRSEFGPIWGGSFTYSLSDFTSMGGLSDILYNIVQIRATANLLDRDLTPYAGPRITLGGGTNAIVPTYPGAQAAPTTRKVLHLDFTRIDWMAGFRWAVVGRHEVLGDLSITSYFDTSEYEYWDGDRETAEDVIDRDDYLFLVTYRYRF